MALKDTEINKGKVKKSRVDVTSTLLDIPRGSTYSFDIKKVKKSSLCSAARRLNGRGYKFVVTEKGRIDDVLVTRFL